MGGHGAGPGMMGGYGYGGVASLDLSDEQQEKVFAIQEEHRRKNWDTMGKMRAEQFKLRRMYYADEADPKAVSEQQKKVDELRRQLLVTRLEVRKQIEAVLTPEQRKQVRQFGPWWASEDDD
jgi:Spy/CpxP family protein refolding chaperone